MKRMVVAWLGFAFGSVMSVAQPTPADGWKATDEVFGVPGKDLQGTVHKFSWPRTDLRVSVSDVMIEPSLALGSWGAFQRMDNGQAEVMGDLVLLSAEVSPVVRSLEGDGFEILAIHNHLIGENPRVMYVHYEGHGEPVALARKLKAALGKSATPMGSSAASPKPTAEQEKTLGALQDALGRKGTMAGRVLQLSVPRVEEIRDGGMVVPPAMGMAIAVNFQTVGSKVATTGDFVLVAEEVSPVIRELHAHGIEVTALHSHMLRETPRLFFLHFWGVSAPEEIAAGVRTALSKVAVR